MIYRIHDNVRNGEILKHVSTVKKKMQLMAKVCCSVKPNDEYMQVYNQQVGN